MEFIFTAPNISKPTADTFEDYSVKKLSKLKKFLREKKDAKHQLRMSISKQGDEFEIMAELFNSEHIVVKARNRAIKPAIDNIYDQMKRKLTEGKEKRVDLARVRRRFKDAFPKYS